MFETFGKENEYIESVSISSKKSDRIWTVCEENNQTFVIAGWHFVNRLGYIITEIPFTDKDEQFTI
jgi:hypothetical protein